MSKKSNRFLDNLERATKTSYGIPLAQNLLQQETLCTTLTTPSTFYYDKI